MSRPRSYRRIAIGACALLCIAGLFVTIGWFRLSGSALPTRGSVRVPGLLQTVVVQVDTFGIPSVNAGSETDLLRALGYLHATDRMWQMEFFRRVAAGRLAELFGRDLVGTDRLVRTLDLWGAAERAAQGLDLDERERLLAYSAGVNARLDDVGKPLAPEFSLLRFKPEPWDPVSVMAVGMVMNLDLSHWRRDLSRFWASRHMEPDRAAVLSRPYPEWGTTILSGPVLIPAGVRTSPPAPPTGDETNPAAALEARDQSPAPGRADGGAAPSMWQAFEVLESVSARSASNAWVISGRRTASGHPILANDMHLSLRAPSIWYLAALHADSADFHAAGFTLPGVPGIVVGHNRAVAWGFTNGMIDDMDFAIESSSEDGLRYLDRGEWIEYTVRAETLQVRGADPQVIHVRGTRRGPVVSDALPGLGADLTAVWTALSSDARSTGLWNMNLARSLTEFDRAVQGFAQPHQNVVFASVDGRIGYRLAGRVPVRGDWDGSLPVEAARMDAGFRGTWPPAMHPSGFDPPAGFFATANNLQAPGLGTAISTDYAAPLRAERISRRLEARRDWSVETVYDLQRDTYSLIGERYLPLAIATARRMGREDEAARLEVWDRRVDTGSLGAPLFYSWLYRLRSLIAADEYAEGPQWAFFPMKSFMAVLEEGDASPWIDDVRTPERETLDELAARAMDDAAAAVGEASWGELHRERHSHPLGRSRWLQRLFGFSVGPYPSAGGPNTVRPDDYRKWDALDATSWSPPWLSEYGPSERFIAELGPEGPVGRFLIPTGQSGNPFSRHYRDLNERWRAGELVEVPLQRARFSSRSVRQIRIVPARVNGDE
jgi:penicillin amidase